MPTPFPLLPSGVLILAGGQSRRMGTPKALMKLPSGLTLLEHHVQYARAFGVPIWIADNGQGFSVNDTLAEQLKTQGVFIEHISDYQPKQTCLNNNIQKNVTNNLSDNQNHNETQVYKGVGALGAILTGLMTLSKQMPISNLGSTGIKDSDSVNRNQSTLNTSELFNTAEQRTPYLPYLLVISCDSLIKADRLWDLLICSDLYHYSESPLHQHQTHVHFEQQCRSLPAINYLISIEDNPINNQSYPLLGLYHASLIKPLRNFLDSGNRQVMRFISDISNSNHADNWSVKRSPMPKFWQPLANLNTPEQFNDACHYISEYHEV